MLPVSLGVLTLRILLIIYEEDAVVFAYRLHSRSRAQGVLQNLAWKIFAKIAYCIMGDRSGTKLPNTLILNRVKADGPCLVIAASPWTMT